MVLYTMLHIVKKPLACIDRFLEKVPVLEHDYCVNMILSESRASSIQYSHLKNSLG